MMKNSIYILLIFLFGSCQNKSFKFRNDTFISAGVEYKFQIVLPRGFKSIKKKKLEPDVLKQFVYSSSEVIYISLDITYSNSPNKKNWLICSLPNKGKKCTEGKQENGLYWKELLIHNLVIGYYNISIDKKKQFDKTISSFKTLNKEN